MFLAGLRQTSKGQRVLDLTAVSLMDSAGLGLTTAVLERAESAGLRVADVVANPR